MLPSMPDPSAYMWTSAQLFISSSTACSLLVVMCVSNSHVHLGDCCTASMVSTITGLIGKTWNNSCNGVGYFFGLCLAAFLTCEYNGCVEGSVAIRRASQKQYLSISKSMGRISVCASRTSLAVVCKAPVMWMATILCTRTNLVAAPTDPLDFWIPSPLCWIDVSQTLAA